MTYKFNNDSHKNNDDFLYIGNQAFKSRLMLGSGKYKNLNDAQECIIYSGCEIVTVAIRRAQNSKHHHLMENFDWSKIWLLPNTAGCTSCEESIRVAKLGREIVKKIGQEDNNFIKLEVIPDPSYLLPDPIGTLKAAEYLINKGFSVLPYINADPILAKQLEEIGCVTVMPLGSPIGSGQGLKNQSNIQIIINNAKVPVIIDAGIGSASDASLALEMGADGVLINTAIARASSSKIMAKAMKLAVEAGRLSYLAGRIPVSKQALASSPIVGIPNIKK
uniref:thiamin biosynthesis protein G n=1 Tax=Glaucosphaera vacuolata TaxID=38265 RepID=UPI001FCDA187|nr:thiamin biosynthesis protein G [Glaucosphaera vacuolata]UNJ18710.1 thiamin biosynthesis protein G [Glaucosphaera vacuolata]